MKYKFSEMNVLKSQLELCMMAKTFNSRSQATELEDRYGYIERTHLKKQTKKKKKKEKENPIQQTFTKSGSSDKQNLEANTMSEKVLHKTLPHFNLK